MDFSTNKTFTEKNIPEQYIYQRDAVMPDGCLCDKEVEGAVENHFANLNSPRHTLSLGRHLYSYFIRPAKLNFGE